MIHPGAVQVTSKKILIFGGMVEEDDPESENDFIMNDNGQKIRLTDASWFLDVTNGSIKNGPDLQTPSYYLANAGNMICIENHLYAQGFGINNDMRKYPSDEKKKEKPQEELRDASNIYYHKKVLHNYDQATQEFSQINEGIFNASSNRKGADLDETLPL